MCVSVLFLAGLVGVWGWCGWPVGGAARLPSSRARVLSSCRGGASGRAVLCGAWWPVAVLLARRCVALGAPARTCASACTYVRTST